jgi:hypothetical protein
MGIGDYPTGGNIQVGNQTIIMKLKDNVQEACFAAVIISKGSTKRGSGLGWFIYPFEPVRRVLNSPRGYSQ